jgi:hypothetical protein
MPFTRNQKIAAGVASGTLLLIVIVVIIYFVFIKDTTKPRSTTKPTKSSSTTNSSGPTNTSGPTKKATDPNLIYEDDIVRIKITRTDKNTQIRIEEPSDYFVNEPFKGCWSILDANRRHPDAGITCDNSTIEIRLPYNLNATPLLADTNGNFICSRDITDTRPPHAEIPRGGEKAFSRGLCGFKFTKTNDIPRLIGLRNVDNIIRVGDSIENSIMNPRFLKLS